MRWLLPLLLACCTTGCGGCVDDPDAAPPGPASTATSPITRPLLGRGPRMMRTGQHVDEGGAPQPGDTE